MVTVSSRHLLPGVGVPGTIPVTHPGVWGDDGSGHGVASPGQDGSVQHLVQGAGRAGCMALLHPPLAARTVNLQ